MLLAIPAVVLAVEALVRWPVLEYVVKFLFLAAWGAMTPGAVLYVIVAIHLPAGNVGKAVFAAIVGGAVSIPWVMVCWNVLQHTARRR
ncbi:MAG: hypothetical protein ACK52V_04685 [Betaproteobacteria bacterium]